MHKLLRLLGLGILLAVFYLGTLVLERVFLDKLMPKVYEFLGWLSRWVPCLRFFVKQERRIIII